MTRALLAGESGEQAVAFGGEFFVRHAAFGVARKVWFQAIEEEHFVCAFVLSHDGTSRLQFKEEFIKASQAGTVEVKLK